METVLNDDFDSDCKNPGHRAGVGATLRYFAAVRRIGKSLALVIALLAPIVAVAIIGYAAIYGTAPLMEAVHSISANIDWSTTSAIAFGIGLLLAVGCPLGSYLFGFVGYYHHPFGD